MLKLGKKTKAWNNARKILKIKFEELGITSCELRLPGCTFGAFLSFAHIDKRRKLTEDELFEVVLACINCHQYVEYQLPRGEMRKKLEAIIKRRAYL